MVQLMKTSRQLYAEHLPEILKKHGVANKMAGPRIEKVCVVSVP